MKSRTAKKIFKTCRGLNDSRVWPPSTMKVKNSPHNMRTILRAQARLCLASFAPPGLSLAIWYAHQRAIARLSVQPSFPELLDELDRKWGRASWLKRLGLRSNH